MPTDVDGLENEHIIEMFIQKVIYDPTKPKNYIQRIKEKRGKGTTKGCTKICKTDE